MSIDGFNLAAIQDVPLTAVHVPRDELGTEAVHMLQQRLMRPDAPVGTLLLNGTLTVRGVGTADTSGETTHRRGAGRAVRQLSHAQRPPAVDVEIVHGKAVLPAFLIILAREITR